MKNSDTEAFVLDSSAFYSGFHLSNGKKYYTTPLILDEVRHLTNLTSSYDALIISESLFELEPDVRSVSMTRTTAFSSGDIDRLSDADISIISLSYQLGYPLVSDDYCVQNVSKIMGIKIISLGISEISKIRKWINFCKTCGKGYSPKITECTICGNKTRRRYKNR